MKIRITPSVIDEMDGALEDCQRNNSIGDPTDKTYEVVQMTDEEILRIADPYGFEEGTLCIIDFARRILEAAKGEPVAWMTESGLLLHNKLMPFHKENNPGIAAHFNIPLYTHPASPCAKCAELEKKAEMDYAIMAGDAALITGLKNDLSTLRNEVLEEVLSVLVERGFSEASALVMEIRRLKTPSAGGGE